MLFLMKLLYRRMVRQASYQTFMGRMIDPQRPEQGRFLRHGVDAILEQTWRNVEEILPEAQLERLPTFGSRHNVFLAVLTVAAYRAHLAAGIEKSHAMELFADVGWKLYTRFIVLPRLAARLVTRDPQRQMNFILHVLMWFPFGAPGRPGYEVRAWAEPDRFCTYWTYCPPYAFVRRYVEKHGDRGEVEAFRRSWCSYDWAFAYALVDGGYGRRGHYERPHTLSAGDDVCDMCWYARAPRESGTPVARATGQRASSA